MTLSTLVFYEHVCDDECLTGEEYGNFLTVHFVTHLAQPVSSASRPNAGEQHPGRQHNYLEGDSCVFTAKYRIRSNQSMIIVLLKPDKSSHSLKRFRPMSLLYRNFQLMEQTLLETVISREQASFEPNQIPAIKCSCSQSKLKSDFGKLRNWCAFYRAHIRVRYSVTRQVTSQTDRCCALQNNDETHD